MKKKNKSKNDNSKILTYIAWSLTFIVVSFSSLAIGYYFGFDDGVSREIKNTQDAKNKQLAILKEKNTQNSTLSARLKDVLKEDKEKNVEVDAKHEYDSTSLAKPPKRDRQEKLVIGTKPKLAIILDDVSVKSQVEAIKSLKLPLTMSFLPPSDTRPNSHKLAKNEDFYMVHLPMEAMSFTKEEPYTLRVDDTQDEILQRIKEIKNLFPKVKYINNHTGSKFTSDEMAVNRLIYALNKENINFIDSRTIAQTKVPKVMSSFGYKYVGRDVFLDHQPDVSYAKDQIKEAIRVAKTHGSAIAIGHPHKNTLQAINESKALFGDVELVLVNKL